MQYTAKNFESLKNMPGLSDQLLVNHVVLYQGYVANLNKLTESVKKMGEEDRLATPEYAELKRRLGWEYNGVRLHELYFENISAAGIEAGNASPVYKKIEEEFNSFENWVKFFKATAAMRGIGWVVLYYDRKMDKLFNTWINEHDQGHLAGCEPLLVMDVFEHAYLADYGIKKADYIEAFFKIINWQKVDERLVG